MVSQKTIRFYSDSKEDASALELLSNHRKYGYDSERKMMIEAINLLPNHEGASGINCDAVADKVVDRLMNMGFVIDNNAGEAVTSTNDNNLDLALSFIDQL